mmetsp:Transcript_3446/g.5183  ORF Transcript_3446/g.5183 Transcript_3446/m.5183 type:complete len:250 (-) Transcript_3446:60-809(-)
MSVKAELHGTLSGHRVQVEEGVLLGNMCSKIIPQVFRVVHHANGSILHGKTQLIPWLVPKLWEFERKVTIIGIHIFTVPVLLEIAQRVGCLLLILGELIPPLAFGGRVGSLTLPRLLTPSKTHVLGCLVVGNKFSPVGGGVVINEAVPRLLGKSDLGSTDLLVCGQVIPSLTFYIGKAECVPCNGSVVELVCGGLLLYTVEFAEFLVPKIRLGDREDVFSCQCTSGKGRDDGCGECGRHGCGFRKEIQM